MARALNDWLKTYMRYTAYNEAPDIFHIWAGIGTIAAALRRKVYFDQMPTYMWTPNFYIIFVGPPGIVQKSTTMGQGVSLLEKIPGVKFGPNALTWPALVTGLASSCQMVQQSDGLLYPMSCLTFASSELGTLLDPEDRKMIDVLVDFWDGRTTVWRKETKCSGNDTIENPWLNIMACTTPIWLADSIPRTMIGGGFTSRCVFVFADKKRKLIAYPKDHTPHGILALRDSLIHDLEVISLLKGEMRLSPEARAVGEAWYQSHYEHPPAGIANDMQFQGYIGRKQGHLHKLAMVLSASESDSLVIEARHLERALGMLSTVENTLPRVFQAVNSNVVMAAADRIVAAVQEKGRIRKNALYSQFFHSMSYKDFIDHVNSACEAGLIHLHQDGTEVYFLAEPAVRSSAVVSPQTCPESPCELESAEIAQGVQQLAELSPTLRALLTTPV